MKFVGAATFGAMLGCSVLVDLSKLGTNADGGTPCIDTTSDANNCGACGHSCLGGACSKSACKPVVLASNQLRPEHIAASNTAVYWTTVTGGTVMRWASSNVAVPASIAIFQQTPSFIATDGDQVLWLTGNAQTKGSVMQCAGAACTPAASAANQPQPSGLGAAAGKVVWTTHLTSSGSVLACSEASCTASTVASGTNPNFVTTDGTNVVWVDAGDVLMCAIAGCVTPTKLAPKQDPTAIVMDATSVYWAISAGDIVKCDKGGCPTPTPLASAQSNVQGIAFDAAYLYWTGSADGTIRRCAIAGTGAVETIADSQTAPMAIAVDALEVYWTSSSAGTVTRIAKPVQ